MEEASRSRVIPVFEKSAGKGWRPSNSSDDAFDAGLKRLSLGREAQDIAQLGIELEKVPKV
jgi:hypothetical protein